MATDAVYHEMTRKSKYTYLFSSKHHGGGASGDSEWSKDVSQAEEFSIFDEADFHDISDADGWLYGVLRSVEGKLRDLGTWQQQVAEFRQGSPGMAWHGYPLWAVNQDAPPNRANEKMRP